MIRSKSIESLENKRGYCVLRKAGVNKKHRLAKVYEHMIERCYNPNHCSFEDYGARGIYVCARWFYSFQNFIDDMGKRPRGKTLDRIDVNGIYSPDNCRWATWNEQANNRTNNIPADIVKRMKAMRKENKSIRDIAAACGVSYGAVYNRVEVSAVPRAAWERKKEIRKRIRWLSPEDRLRFKCLTLDFEISPEETYEFLDRLGVMVFCGMRFTPIVMNQ